MSFKEYIREGKTIEFKNVFESAIREACAEKVEEVSESLIKRVNRVRGGDIQRNKTVVTDNNYKISGGKVVRQSAEEKRNREISQRQGAVKRKSKLSQALRAKKISLRKRAAAGFNK